MNIRWEGHVKLQQHQQCLLSRDTFYPGISNIAIAHIDSIRFFFHVGIVYIELDSDIDIGPSSTCWTCRYHIYDISRLLHVDFLFPRISVSYRTRFRYINISVTNRRTYFVPGTRYIPGIKQQHAACKSLSFEGGKSISQAYEVVFWNLYDYVHTTTGDHNK